MSLLGCDLFDHVVTQRCLQFIEASVLEDGSWPIDTNLTTWVTTLSVNALGERQGVSPPSDQDRTRRADALRSPFAVGCLASNIAGFIPTRTRLPEAGRGRICLEEFRTLTTHRAPC
ncbi:MAG: hypothetical protein WKF77_29065 [Planctomycetaceae bacterium]